MCRLHYAKFQSFELIFSYKTMEDLSIGKVKNYTNLIIAIRVILLIKIK